ncbi:MAG TPA: branched-chain amino acid ABC transporter permease [Chloroflexota bacterium]|nr:branched-chain amino acid ABC transporter permease [Chloroflexota bacterium]
MLALLANLALVGLTLGSMYALLAVSFGIIFNVTHVFHLAHGATFTLGGYAMYWISTMLGLPFVAALVGGLIAASVFGVLVEVVLYRPLRRLNSPPMILFLSSVGALTVIEGLIGLLFGTQTLTFKSLPLEAVNVGAVTLPSANLAMPLSWIVIAAVVVYMVRTRSGKFLRAVGDSPRVAMALGIPLDMTYILSFALGSALAVLSALLYGWSQGLTPQMGLSAILIGSAGVIIGGRHGVLPGAIVAVVLGTLQAVLVAFVPSGWQEGATFALLLVALLVRPQGIFGYSLPW